MSARPTRAAARRRKEKTMNLYRITYGTPDSEAEASYNSLVDRTTAAEARAEAAEDEIVTLKAKLYDYITAGA